MSTNGQLVFTDVDKITFKGVGNASNAVIDTLTGKIGVGVDSPEANLHVLGNSYVSTNLELGGTLIMGTVNVEAQHSLEAVTATGNITPLTLEFTNPTTSLVASGNVVVTGNVVAGYLYGDGSNISGISSNLDQIVNIGNVTSNTVQFTNATTGFVTTANVEVGGELTVSGNVEVGTANLFVDTVNSRVGIGTANPNVLLELSSDTGSTTIVPTELRLSSSTNAGDWDTTTPYARLAFYTGDVTADAPGVMASIGAVASSANGGENTRLAFFTADPHDERMCVDRYGNVGIGTTSPNTTLHVKNETDSSGTGDAYISDKTKKPTECLRLQGKYHSTGSGALLRFTNQHNSGTFPNTGEYNLAGIAGYDHDNSWGGGLAFYTSPGSGTGGDNLTHRMSIDESGRVGIGTTNPGAILEVISTTEIPRLRGDAGRSLFMGSNYTHVNSTGFSETNLSYAWDGYPGVIRMNNNNGEYRIHGQGGSYTVLCRTDGGFVPFTGLHETFLPFDEDDQGKIVYSTGNYASELKDGNVDGVMYDYLTILDACPVVKICATENDKRVMGVLSTRHRRTQIKEITKEEYELITGDEKYTYEKKDGADVYIGEINTDEFSRGYYNAVGEGSIWVCNKNGNFENGDYITSSTVAGYGQKQNDDLLHNYTVAKITADCDFSEIWVTTKKHKKTREGYLFNENKEPVYENILDAEGNTRTHLKFKIRYLLPDGTQISEEEYTTRDLADEKVYVAALVGCTYHCG